MAAPLQMDVAVEGDKLAADRILQVGERAADVRPARPLLDPIFRREEVAGFAEDGPGWQALADATVALKENNGWDPRILRRTGELERRLTSTGEDLEVGLMGSPTEIAFGTTVPYARFHQYGEGVPRREVVGLSTTAVAAMTEGVQVYIVDGVGA